MLGDQLQNHPSSIVDQDQLKQPQASSWCMAAQAECNPYDKKKKNQKRKRTPTQAEQEKEDEEE